MLCAVKYDSTIYLHQIWYNPVIDLSQGGRDVIAGLEGPPSPITHPVLLAKRMLITALFLQYFPPGSSHHFTEAPREIGLRMAEEAIKLVTTNEGLHGWTESVELILLEALWHANIGNLRRAWLALRRAMSVGQLMGLDRATAPAHFRVLDTSRIPDTQFMWHNIVYQDRYLSLILGLPCGVVDDMTEYERKVPSGLSGTTWLSLELQHSRITRRLLNRGKSTDPDSDTKELDIMLLQAAKSVPDSFWSLPSFEKPDDEQGAFWRTLAGMNQIKHYSLLSCLHLPYLMREDPDGKYEHLKVTCLMASREILRRYNAYRAAKPVLSCCRPLDFVALFASLTVMVAQMNTHRPHMTYSFLGQQRPNDRKLIEEVLTTMDRVAQLNDDAMTFQSVSLLRQLMHIESDAFAGHCYVTEEVSETESTVSEGRCTNMDKCSNVLLLDIPYFGTIRISRQQTQEADRQQTTEPYGALPADKINVLGGEPRTSSSAVAPYPVFTGGFDFSLQIGSDSNLDPFHQANYPDLTATVDDWAFQGVDTAFFGSIMSNGNFNFGTDDGVDTSLR